MKILARGQVQFTEAEKGEGASALSFSPAVLSMQDEPSTDQNPWYSRYEVLMRVMKGGENVTAYATIPVQGGFVVSDSTHVAFTYSKIYLVEGSNNTTVEKTSITTSDVVVDVYYRFRITNFTDSADLDGYFDVKVEIDTTIAPDSIEHDTWEESYRYHYNVIRTSRITELEELMSSIDDDSILDTVEKSKILAKWVEINGSAVFNNTTGTTGTYWVAKNKLDTMVVANTNNNQLRQLVVYDNTITSYGQYDTTELVNAYTALKNYLSGLNLTSNTNTTNFDRSVLAEKLRNYYVALERANYYLADNAADIAEETKNTVADALDDFEYLKDALSEEDLTTEITDGLILSNIIGVKDNNYNVVAALNGLGTLSGFNNNTHGPIMLATGISTLEPIGGGEIPATTKIYADGTIVCNNAIFGGTEGIIINGSTGKITFGENCILEFSGDVTITQSEFDTLLSQSTQEINGTKITNNSITSSQIASNAITADKILTGAVTADKINTNNLTVRLVDVINANNTRIAYIGDTSYPIYAGGTSTSNAAFKVSANGDVYANTITLRSGIIGADLHGFTFNSNNNASYIYIGVTSLSDDAHDGVYIGTDGINIGGKFVADDNGAVTATSMTISGNSTFSGSLSAATGTFNGDISAASGTFKGAVTVYNTAGTSIIAKIGDTDFPIWAGSSKANANFKVSNTGVLTASGATLTTATVTGTLNASEGKIGSSSTSGKYFNIGGNTDKAWIYSNISSYDGTGSGIYLGTDGINLGGAFKVTNAGALTASNATITGGSISITNGSTNIFNVSSSGMTLGSGFSISNTGAVTASSLSITGGSININNGAFSVTNTGVLNATGATISGTLTASANSTIGPFTVTNNAIYNTQTSYNGDTAGIYLGTDGIGLGAGNFKVTNAGVLTAAGATLTTANVTGTINAESGTIIGRLSIGSAGDVYSVTSYEYNGLTFTGWSKFDHSGITCYGERTNGNDSTAYLTGHSLLIHSEDGSRWNASLYAGGLSIYRDTTYTPVWTTDSWREIKIVSSLPNSPDSNTLYFVTS